MDSQQQWTVVDPSHAPCASNMVLTQAHGLCWDCGLSLLPTAQPLGHGTDIYTVPRCSPHFRSRLPHYRPHTHTTAHTHTHYGRTTTGYVDDGGYTGDSYTTTVMSRTR